MNGQALHIGLIGPVPPPNGGMAMQTEQLVRLLRGEGIEVTLLPVNPPYRPACVASIPVLRAICRLLWYLAAVWRLAGRVDTIHLMANSGWSWQLFAAPVLWLAALRSTPVIVNYRGGEARDYFLKSFRWVKPSLERAAVIVVPSGFLAQVFKEFGQSTRVVPNIIDRRVFQPTRQCVVQPRSGIQEEGATPARTFDLVITRNLEPIYGIDTAIRALAKVREAGCPVRLLVAGSGPAESDLKELAIALGVSEAVEFVGRLDRAGIADLYDAADAMVNPTNVDNMPNSVLEALACGLPVVSTDVGGIPYILTHEQTALLVPPRDIEALAAAIIRLSKDEMLRHRLRDNGLEQVEQYTWHNVRDLWLQTYHDAIAENRKQAA